MIEFKFKSKHSVVFSPQTWLFPAGEVGLNISAARFMAEEGSPCHILARINSSNDLLQLFLAVNALREMNPALDITLTLPYFPYSRQDRVCAPGDPFSLKAVARLINSLECTFVQTLDPHSSVLGACVDRFVQVTQLEILSKFEQLNLFVMENKAMIVAPDAGAQKKACDVAKYFGHASFVCCYKSRNPSTGEITGIEVADSVEGKDLLIVDDICDGGKTFTELAVALKQKGAKTISLYVTHGIFSKGTRILYESGISNIFTTNSFYKTFPASVSSKVVTIEIENLV